MAQEKTFYDGQWRTKDDAAPLNDPLARIASLSAELEALRVLLESGGSLAGEVSALDMQLEALGVTVGGNYNAANAAHNSQAAQITALQNAVAAFGSSSVSVQSLAPVHRWRASNATESAGTVSAIPDEGSLNKPFAPLTAARVAKGTDANGCKYLDFTGTQIYQAGVAADWAWLSDLTQQYAIMLVIQDDTPFRGHGSNPGAQECIVTTADYTSTAGRGIALARGSAGAADGVGAGFDFLVQHGNVYSAYVSFQRLRPTGQHYTGVELLFWNYYRPSAFVSNTIGYSNGPVSSTLASPAADCWAGKHLAAWCTSNLTTPPSVAANQRPLSLGAMVPLAIPLAGKVYELALFKKNLSPFEIHHCAAAVAQTYAIDLSKY